jgi:hypothetical protein
MAQRHAPPDGLFNNLALAWAHAPAAYQAQLQESAALRTACSKSCCATIKSQQACRRWQHNCLHAPGDGRHNLMHAQRACSLITKRMRMQRGAAPAGEALGALPVGVAQRIHLLLARPRARAVVPAPTAMLSLKGKKIDQACPSSAQHREGGSAPRMRRGTCAQQQQQPYVLRDAMRLSMPWKCRAKVSTSPAAKPAGTLCDVLYPVTTPMPALRRAQV